MVRYSCFVTAFDTNTHAQDELVVVFPLQGIQHRAIVFINWRVEMLFPLFAKHSIWPTDSYQVEFGPIEIPDLLTVLFYTRGRTFSAAMTLQRQLNSSAHVFIWRFIKFYHCIETKNSSQTIVNNNSWKFRENIRFLCVFHIVSPGKSKSTLYLFLNCTHKLQEF